jgi:hypothetical protein
MNNPSLNRPSLLDQPSESLEARVVSLVHKHWVRPHAAEPLPPVATNRLEEVARAALDTMLTRQFRVGPLPPPELYNAFLAMVCRFVRKAKPIRVTVGFGPLKKQKGVAYSRADWAEFFALGHLVAWHDKVQRVYPPGLQFQLYFDDETLLLANAANKELMDSYISSINDLIDALGYRSLFLPPKRITDFAWFLRFGPYQLFRFVLLRIGEWRVRRWERDPANRETLDRMKEYARRNVSVPTGLDPAAEERFVAHASHRFRVCWDALRLGASIFPDRERLLALYLDGSQHHRRQVALHLTSVDKGQMTQPWQGEGVLLDNGRGKLEPFVLTAGRRERYHSIAVEGLNLVPRPGFERLTVVWPTTHEAPSSDRPADNSTTATAH